MRHLQYEKAILESIAYLNSDQAFSDIEDHPYWTKWNTPWWQMSVLFEMGLAHLIPRTTAEALLKKIRVTHLDYFFTQDAPADEKPDQGPPCPCALGNIYQILSAVGLDVDQALPWARNWFLKYQMPDGGLNCDEDAYHADSHASSMVGTISPLEAILLTGKKLTPDEEQFVDRGAHCLLERELRLGSASKHNAEEKGDEEDWLKPSFPRFYFYDVLRGLSFILKWSELRKQPLHEKDIHEVMNHLEKISKPDGFRVERHAYEGVNTRVKAHQYGKVREPALRYPLLDEVSAIGEISPFLGASFADAKLRFEKLKKSGLIR